ncbi:hypothetical protein [Aliiroseovarius sp.]
MELPVAFIELLTATVMLFGAMPLFKNCRVSPESVNINGKYWGKRQ